MSLRRAAEVYQRLIDRFAPQQKTNYVDLLSSGASGSTAIRFSVGN